MIRKSVICAFLAIALLLHSLALANNRSEGIDSGWLDSVISIEIVNQSGKAIPIGSGFLIRTPNDHIVLVTAKHIIIDAKKKILSNLVYRFYKKLGGSYLLHENSLQLDAGNWFLSESSDVACRFIKWGETTQITVATYDNLLTMSVLKPAAPILILGFPLGLRSEEHSNPVVRQGIVARVNPTNILIDAMIYPGNSGGPVLYFPTVKVGKGLHSPFINEEKIIGLVANYIAYTDIAISLQTKRPRITFEENSGLCHVIPSDYILEIFNREDFKDFDESLK